MPTIRPIGEKLIGDDFVIPEQLCLSKGKDTGDDFAVNDQLPQHRIAWVVLVAKNHGNILHREAIVDEHINTKHTLGVNAVSQNFYPAI